MKRIVSLLLLLCLSLNSFAGTIGMQKLERELHEYHFAMTVEWDQKDQAFYDAKTKQFFSSMEKIIREEGISKAEVLTLVEKKLVSHKAIEALKLKLTLLSNVNSSEELARSLQKHAKDMYSQGASWNGEFTFPVVLGIIVIGIIAYKWWWEQNHVCTAWEERYDCRTTSWNDQDCDTWVDEDGNSYEECDYYYQREDTTTCGMMNFCTSYQEI